MEERCEGCGDLGFDGDPVIEFHIDDDGGTGYAHLECAEGMGWET